MGESLERRQRQVMQSLRGRGAALFLRYRNMNGFQAESDIRFANLLERSGTACGWSGRKGEGWGAARG